jgi:hypothetical protein
MDGFWFLSPSRGARPAAPGTAGPEAALPEGEDRAASNQALNRQAGTRADRAVQESEAAQAGTTDPEAGRPLPNSLRAAMERRFGADFGTVRIHDGNQSAARAAALRARAFTAGESIHFGTGQFRPGTAAGTRLLAHELAHVIQGRRAGSAAKEVKETSEPHDAGEREARQVADRIAAGRPVPVLSARPSARVMRDDADPDHPPAPPEPAREADVELEPLADWLPIVDPRDPTQFMTPVGTTRDQIATRLYGDPAHYGGFDIVGEQLVRMRTFDGVASDVKEPMRGALETQLAADVATVISVLSERIISDADERQLLSVTVRWSSRSALADARGTSYFDRYLDALEGQRLTMERPWPFSNITHTALEWLLDEAEQKAWEIRRLIARGSTRAPMAGTEAGDRRVIGPMSRGAVVGGYAYRTKRAALAIGEWDYGTGPIQVSERVVDEPTASLAEIALRNAPHAGPRVMIPGGDGHFYGYTIAFPRLEQGYVEPEDKWNTNRAPEHIDNWWWHYTGTVAIVGGEFQPESGTSSGFAGADERTKRMELLTRALAGGPADQRGLDFDALGLASLDQRVTLIDAAIVRHEDADASLIARVLYATPGADFPLLERRLSTNGTMDRLVRMPDPGGRLATIGRIFTVKAVATMQVAGENLQDLPELTAGVDEDGFFHCADVASATVASRTVSDADFPAQAGGQVALGHERTVGGETPGAFNRSTITIQPQIIRVGSLAGNLWRSMRGTMLQSGGPPVGPLLPTQLVRVRLLGPTVETRVVTALEAAGLLAPPSGEILQRAISSTIHGYMWIMAGTGLLRAFGPALAGALVEGGGLRAAGTALAETAAGTAGRTALVHAGLIAGMEAVEGNRSAIAATPDGRAFLEIYDVAVAIWISRDVARLIGSGLIPRLVSAADRVAALPGAIRDAIMPMRAEAEALRRTIARYATPAEAAAAATADGATMAAGTAAEARPGFFAMLRVSRGEVAAERLTGKLAGTSGEAAGRRVLGRLEGAISRAESEAAAITGTTPEALEARAAAARRAERAASARFAVAQRAAQLRPDVREAFLNAVDGVIARRPNALAAMTDLLTAAAQSRTPIVFMGEVRALVNRPGISDEALAVLGGKVRRGQDVLDLAWLNRTRIADDTLDFLGRDQRTPWDLYRRTALDPASGSLIVSFRTSARGAGAELVAADSAAQIGTNVRRQVRMGSSEIDYEITVAGRRHGLEIKGWTPDTWDDALEAAIQRINRRGLTDAQKEAVRKIDTMLRQLQDAQAATGNVPYLGLTDGLSAEQLGRLRRVLGANGLAATGRQLVPLSEARIREAAQGTIGETLGIPRP